MIGEIQTMNDFIISRKHSLWECNGSHDCEQRKGSRKGSTYRQLFNELNKFDPEELDDPEVDEILAKYGVSDSDIEEDSVLYNYFYAPFQSENEWDKEIGSGSKLGSRKGSRKGVSKSDAIEWLMINGMGDTESEAEEEFNSIVEIANKFNITFERAAEVKAVYYDYDGSKSLEEIVSQDIRPEDPFIRHGM